MFFVGAHSLETRVETISHEIFDAQHVDVVVMRRRQPLFDYLSLELGTFLIAVELAHNAGLENSVIALVINHLTVVRMIEVTRQKHCRPTSFQQKLATKMGGKEQGWIWRVKLPFAGDGPSELYKRCE